MADVKTKEGHLHTSGDRGSNLPAHTPEQLEGIAAGANKLAEELGIKTRYEVVE